jgi:hypothetical protein
LLEDWENHWGYIESMAWKTIAKCLVYPSIDKMKLYYGIYFLFTEKGDRGAVEKSVKKWSILKEIYPCM